MTVDILTLAAATGSDGGLGKIGTVPQTTGVLCVRLNAGPDIEKVEWLLQVDRNCTLQCYRSLTIVDVQTLTLASLADTETLFVNGLTLTGESTEADALASARKFHVGGDDTADAAALAALINDSSYGVPGVQASSALGVVTLTPKGHFGAPTIHAVTGTAAGHCAVASGTVANLARDGAAVSHTAVTTDGGVLVAQETKGWPYAYFVLSAPAAGAATVVLKAARYRYRD